MQFTYETENLILRVIDQTQAPKVLEFYKNNPEFAEVEPVMHNFYTLQFHETVLGYEYKLILKMNLLRLWIYSKEDPQTIIGTLSFRNISKTFFHSCEVGYKMDKQYRNRGYCSEALQKGFEIMFTEMDIHRIEAIVLPDNQASIHLLEKLGFQREGLKRQCVQLQGKWRDHYQYSLLVDDTPYKKSNPIP